MIKQLAISAFLFVCSCSSAPASGRDASTAHDIAPGSDGASADGPSGNDTGPSGGRIEIYVAGDPTAVTYGDGLAGQTPSNYQIAMSKYWTLRSAGDPAPQLCFDHGGQSVVADMGKDNLVGTCDTQSIAAGLYTHGRTQVDWATYTVAGTVHYLGLPYPGTLTFFRAYSDVTYQGKSYQAGGGFVAFAGITTFELPLTYPPLPNLPNVTFETQNGRFWMTFAYTKPLPIDATDQATHWARFHWQIFESFRWRDDAKPGYVANIWDVSPVFTESELVLLHGVRGYFVTTSLDGP